MAEEGKHSKSDGQSNKSRDISPKSVINPPFTSLPSSASGSMDHRQSDKPSTQLELPIEKKKYGTENPFSDSCRSHPVDPLCKINLRETSEFVKSFPMAKEKNDINLLMGAENLANRPNTEVKGYKRREGHRQSVPPRLDCPGTPSRFVFGAAESPLPVKYMVGGFTRRPFPSKWDDAEKWLINSSSAINSPCNNSNTPGRHWKGNNPNSCRSPFNVYQVRDLNTGSNPSGPVIELHAKEIRQNQIFSHKASGGDDKLMAGTVDTSKEEIYLAGALTIGDVSSRVSSSVLSTDRPVSMSSSAGSASSEHGAFAAYPCETFMKDKFADKVEPASKYRFQESGLEHSHGKSERIPPMKDAATEVGAAVHHRDMGTETTPLASSRTSRCHTPVKNASPVRHNTPSSHSGLVHASGIDIGELEKCHFAKLELQGLSSGIQYTSIDKSISNWSSREEEEEEVSKSLRHFDIGDCKRSILEARATAWEESERSKAYNSLQNPGTRERKQELKLG
ncbi:uncharacterized protein LOC131035023 isoform X2 [Cryptomeria japonica]|uniref:uncharacterized protein LOC131035023 isoform X2 n=1 Tax=Cryptomeria japonica TaxID=3369 RepID=UPI0027DA7347|nr:uncharacterized protein LOC131035023 isoform X2 [Cryptomeria japonica]